jgi:hypothetical protein
VTIVVTGTFLLERSGTCIPRLWSVSVRPTPGQGPPARRRRRSNTVVTRSPEVPGAASSQPDGRSVRTANRGSPASEQAEFLLAALVTRLRPASSLQFAGTEHDGGSSTMTPAAPPREALCTCALASQSFSSQFIAFSWGRPY